MLTILQFTPFSTPRDDWMNPNVERKPLARRMNCQSKPPGGESRILMRSQRILLMVLPTLAAATHASASLAEPQLQPFAHGNRKPLSALQVDDDPPLRLLLNVPYPERLPMLLDVYLCKPWALILAVAPAILGNCSELCGSRCSCVELPAVCDSKHTGGFAKYHHNLLIAPHADGSSDLLYAHADFWLARRMYDHVRSPLYRESILLPSECPTCPVSSCYAPGAYPNFPPSWQTFGPVCQSAMASEAAQGDDYRLLRELGECCHSWADLLYLPRAAQPMFAAMATGPFNATDIHEGAVPTIAKAIAHANVSRLTGLECAGSCCADTGNLTTLAPGQTTYDLIGANTMCAHPVDLRNASAWYAVHAEPAHGSC